MSTTNTSKAGDFCWVELTTKDGKGAKAFYKTLLNWEGEDSPMGPDAVYTMLKYQGKIVGALYEMMPEQMEQGIPSHWLSYIAVENVDETAEKVKALGGKIQAGPFDVMDAGRMAVIKDPCGAVFAIWQTKSHAGIELRNDTGSLCWNELYVADMAKTEAFYTALFGWTSQTEEMGGGVTYTSFFNQGVQHAGMMQMSAEMQEMGLPSHWLPYFTIENCEMKAKEAAEIGGDVMVQPTEIPDVGRFAVVQDPQGAVFNIIEMKTILNS